MREPNLKAREVAIEIARVLHDDKCSDIVVLDVTGLSHVSDYLVIGSGTSDRQMQSAGADAGAAAAKLGYNAYRRSTDDRTTWVLVDCVDVVVHILEPNTRAHYDLEMLWGDAPRIEWERPDQMSRDRAGLGKG
jgi:ribosome-associated protein